MLDSIELFGTTISTYLIWATIAALAGIVCAWFRADTFKLSFTDILFFSIIGAAGLLVGARFIFILTEIPNMIKLGSDYALEIIKTGGIVFYGGVLGLVGGMYLFAKSKNYKTRDIMNWAAPCIPLFHGISRIGCFYAGCCYGKEAEWGMILPYVEAAHPNEPRVPTQLFEVGFNLLLFIGLLVYEKYLRKKNKEMNLLPIYFGFYAVFRFIIEFFRGDEIRGIFFGISTSQWIALFIMAYLVYYYYKQDKKKKAAASVTAVSKEEPKTQEKSDNDQNDE